MIAVGEGDRTPAGPPDEAFAQHDETATYPRRVGVAGGTVAQDVSDGLLGHPKRLPAYLLYDAAGAELFERITELPEYYLTRAERSIFEQRADHIVHAAAGSSRAPFDVVEFGAGTARKSQLLLRPTVLLQGATRFYPVDVSAAALDEAKARIEGSVPGVQVRPLVMRHEDAFLSVKRLERRQLVLFIGSSIGNYDPAEVIELLRGMRATMKPGGCLVLGTDRRKSADVLVPACDDAQGVTAAFNMNMLTRMNREFGARFSLDRFRHVAAWNAEASRIKMHLESLAHQIVPIPGIGAEVSFRKGERIHPESS